MPDTGFLVLSALSVGMGAAVVLFPHGVARLSDRLNRTVQVLDGPIMRHRYLFALMTFAASYAFFQIALLLPQLRG